MDMANIMYRDRAALGRRIGALADGCCDDQRNLVTVIHGIFRDSSDWYLELLKLFIEAVVDIGSIDSNCPGD